MIKFIKYLFDYRKNIKCISDYKEQINSLKMQVALFNEKAKCEFFLERLKKLNNGKT